MKRIVSAMLFFVTASAAAYAAGPETTYRTPRTRDGRPDLQGVWSFANAVPLQRPAKFADKKVFTREEFEKQRSVMQKALTFVATIAPIEDITLDWIDNRQYVDDLRTSLITYPENGRLPALVDGVRRSPAVEEILAGLLESQNGPPPAQFASLLATFGAGKKDSYSDFSRAQRCLESVSVPLMPQFGDSYVQIIQSADSVALVMDGERRVIPITNKLLAPGKIRTSAGTSRGRWEGDTLIVETTNFTARTPGFAGAGNSRDKTVTERFTRTAAGLEYSATVVDPSTFKDRIDLSFPMARVEAQIYEAACHEGNYSLPNALSGARKEEQE